MKLKQYKLKRDLPTFKAGGEFIICCGNLIEVKTDGTLGVCAYSGSTLKKFPNILTDWFEEIKESTRWKPEMGQTYYHVGGDGRVYDDTWVNDSAVDNGRFEIGNCFKTEEEAKRVIEYLKALAVVRGDATKKFVKDENNWYVYYDTDSNSIHSSISCSMLDNGIFGLPHFATREDAQRSIELHKNEWLTIFGIKEEECKKK